MDEYIEREAAIKAIEKADYTLIANDADDCKADYLREIIESVPAADVVPVVRCKDCKHLRVRNQKDIYAFCPKTGIVFWQFEKDTRTSFCSDGERMDGVVDNAAD